MLQTTIGVSRSKSNDPAITEKNKILSDKMQRWLEAHDLGVYVPQRIDGESDNISVEYDPVTKGLKWKPTTITHLAELANPPSIMHYGSYFCGAFNETTWKTISFPDPSDPTKKLTQEDLTLEQLTMYLKHCNDWLKSKRINGVMFMDEPAHKSSDPADPGKYGWTPEAEERNIKWAHACVGAGFELRVAMPGTSQLSWWLPKMPLETVWVLAEKTNPISYRVLLPENAPIWVYNVRSVTLPMMADRLQEFKATGMDVKGVLMWNAVPWTNKNDMPLMFDLSGIDPVPTPAMFTFIDQLKKFDEKPLPALVIKNMSVQDIIETEVIITWTVSDNATGQVEYGLTDNYGLSTKKEESFKYSTHTQKLLNLQPKTTYHYRVHSVNSTGNQVYSDDMTFTTKSFPVSEADKEKLRIIITSVTNDLNSIKLDIKSIDENLLLISKVLG